MPVLRLAAAPVHSVAADVAPACLLRLTRRRLRCDIALNFFTAYYNLDGFLTVDKALIRRRYLKSWFTVDVLACFPATEIGLLMDSDDIQVCLCVSLPLSLSRSVSLCVAVSPVSVPVSGWLGS